jgi:transposase-like protein
MGLSKTRRFAWRKRSSKAIDPGISRACPGSRAAEHLSHVRHEPVTNSTCNTRNGKSKKTLKGDFGELPIQMPRDRHGGFEPQLIAKHSTRWTGFDDKLISR